MSKTFLKLTLISSVAIGVVLQIKQSEAAATISTQNEKYTTVTTDSYCKKWGYTITPKNPATYCNGKYFTCPTDTSAVKCDETAKVGDIKYSDKSSAGTGWLLCNGGTYSKTTYPQLYDLIGTKFSSSSSSPKLPNYRGVFLRGYGSDGDSHTNTSLYTLQDSEVKGHTHSVSWTGYYADFKAKGGGYGAFTFYFNDSAVSINISTGSGSTCPVRKALYPFIYAGVNANGA